MHLYDWLETLIGDYGYALVGVIVALEGMGVPVPGETILVAAAVYAGVTGQLEIGYVIGAAAGGAIIGDNVGYLLGRELGARILQRYGHYLRLTPERLQLGQYLYVRHGGKLVLFARFFALLRTLGAFLAGANRMPHMRFVLCNAAGCLLWAASFGLAANLLGDQMRSMLRPLGIVTLLAVLAALAAVLWLLKRRERTWQREAAQCLYLSAPPPRARKS
jgi:membrane protein DedA with SNARE-associated domain